MRECESEAREFAFGDARERAVDEVFAEFAEDSPAEVMALDGATGDARVTGEPEADGGLLEAIRPEEAPEQVASERDESATPAVDGLFEE
jgi:hypothetical protein